MLSLSSLPLILASGGVAALLAVSIAAQTYLSMLSHGHSFGRMLAWQLAIWGCWTCATPFVLYQGGRFIARRPRTLRDSLRLAGLGLLLIAAHSVIAAQFTIWIQPFVPVETYNFRGCLAHPASCTPFD